MRHGHGTAASAVLLSLLVGSAVAQGPAGAQDPLPDAALEALQLMPPSALFPAVLEAEGGIARLLVQRFVPGNGEEAAEIPSGVVLGFEGECPDGWKTYTDPDDPAEVTLYFPIGLLVDQTGAPRVFNYGLLTACLKQ
ncbi:MAG: hypothetical protein OXF93_07215 [Acidobacteria bacterium]|nr:hypothetical protein [Acidobacteriota bacterium]